MNQIEEIIDRAESLIRDGGWIQGSEFNGKSYCLVGALNHATCHVLNEGMGVNTPRWNTACATAHSLVSWVLSERYYVDGGDIIGFNDDEGRNVDQVLEVLKLAKERAAEVCK